MGIDAGADLDGGRDPGRMRAACLHAGEVGSMRIGTSAGARSASTAARRIDRRDWVERDRRRRGASASERESRNAQEKSGS
jgi:hypothetical protein